ncbi:MAG: hypothetical protein CVV23_04880 [Ignavibacteriae bacterium HGW-Ignavibacteriae-2]|nr:MAG: hypothetical protein CVV23_04880 [Ignavibacteriae bacterium HGW-Ignavibacteriae-2]
MMLNEKILIVEDEQIVALEIRERLTYLGFEVCANVPSGEKALEVIDELKPDLILLDIMLGGKMDGIETGKIIREKYQLPFIFLTAYTDNDTLQRAMAAGPYSYLNKPYEEYELVTAIQIALAKSRLEKALSDREALLSATLSSISDTIFSLDADRNILFMNSKGEKLTGWKLEEVIGKNITQILVITSIVGSESKNNLYDSLFLLDDIVNRIGLCEIVTLFGEKKYVEYIVSPQGDLSHKSFGYVLTLKDITEKKRAEQKILESEEKIYTISSTAEVALYNYNVDSNSYHYISDVIEKIIGYSSWEFKNINLPDIIERYHILKPANINAPFEIIEDWYSGKIEEFQSDLLIKTKSGELKWISDISRPWFDNTGRVIGSVGIIRDISTRKEYEENLKNELEELKIIHDFTRDVNQTKSLPEIYESAVGVIKDIVKSGSTAILIKDKEGEIKCEACSSFNRDNVKIVESYFPWKNEHADKNHITVEVNLNISDSNKDASQNKHSMVYFPLINEGEVLGAVVICFEQEKMLPEEEIHKVHLINSQIAFSIKSKIDKDKLEASEKLLNQAQSIAHVGSLELNLKTNKIFISDELLNIYKIDKQNAPQDLRSFEKIHNNKSEYVKKLFKDAIANNGIYAEFDLELHNGQPISVEIKAIVVYNEKAVPILIRGVVLDITERKKAEVKLIQSEKEYRGIFENAHDAIIVFKPENEIILDVNKRACEIYGFPRSEFIGMSLLNISIDPDKGSKHLKKTLHKGTQHSFITSQYTKDKREIIFEVNASVVLYHDQKAILSINHDITERIKAEDELKKYQNHLEFLVNQRTVALKESEEQFRTLAENNDDIIIRLDINQKILYANPAFKKLNIFNYYKNPEDASNYLKFSDEFSPTILHTIQTVFEKRIKNRIELKIGKMWLDCNILPEVDTNNSVHSVLISARDISNIKYAEETILKRDNLLQAVSEGTMILISGDKYELSLDSSLARVGAISGFDRLFILQLHKELQSGKSLFSQKFEWTSSRIKSSLYDMSFQNIEIESGVTKSWYDEMINGKAVYGNIRDFSNKNNSLLTTQDMKSFAAFPIFVEDDFWGIFALEDCVNIKDWTKGEIAVLNTLAGNIGSAIKRWEVEREINLSKDRWRNLFQFAPEAFYLIDSAGIVVDLNREAEKLIGTPKIKTIGKHISETNLIAKQYAELLNQFIKRCNGGQACGPDEIELVLNEDQKHFVELRSFPIQLIDSDLILISAHDITIRKKAESEIKNALEKAIELNELKSRFVSMVSHEFRTPLSTMLSSVELMEMMGPKLSTDEKNDHFKKIINSVDYMTEMLNDVITINKAEPYHMGVKYSLIEMIEFTKQIIDDIIISFPENTKINFESSADEFTMYTDPKLYRQIISNLVTNAIKYSPNDENIFLKIKIYDGNFKVEVIDKGIGIPKSEISDVFAPFHRASNIENTPGTGLGLAIAKQSVESLGGIIKLKSVVKKGSTFSVTLPVKIDLL